MRKLVSTVGAVGIALSVTTANAQIQPPAPIGGAAPAQAAPAQAVPAQAAPAPAIAAPAPAGDAAAQAAPAPDAAPAQPSWMEYKPVYSGGGESDLTVANRTNDEMTTWAQQSSADVLSFSRDEYNSKMVSFRKYFTPAGWQLYTDYLKTSRLIDMVSQDDYEVGAIVDETPEIVKQAPFNNAYHWIMRMPITISFTKRLPGGDLKRGPTGKFYLFIDVGRVPEGNGDGGVAITNWKIMDAPKK